MRAFMLKFLVPDNLRHVFEAHNLSLMLSLFGFASLLLGLSLLFLGLFGTAGKLAVSPYLASAMNEAGYPFLLNRWFWATILMSSIPLQYIGFLCHPEAQLERKIAREAVFEWKVNNGWLW